MKTQYYFFLTIHYGLFLYAGFFIIKMIFLSWKSYSLHDEITPSEKKAKDEIERVYWLPTIFIGASIVAFFIAAVFYNL
jgi:hypothetical protein